MKTRRQRHRKIPRPLIRWGAALLLAFLAGLLFGRFAPRNAKYMRTMTITAYCSCEKCCEWERDADGEPIFATGPLKGKRKVIGVTASGKVATQGTAAARASTFPFGTVLYIDKLGVFRVEDRGNLKPDQIDIWFPTHEEARQWGRQKRGVIVLDVATPAGVPTQTSERS